MENIRFGKKTVALLLALALMVGCVVGGTVAWLTANSTPVTNTFTTSGIEITLDEENPTNKTAKMVPGWTIAKDPMVTVKAGSEDCYVFVKVDKSANYGTYLRDYAVANEWTKLTDENTTDTVGVEGVYYQKVTGLTEEGAEDWTDYVLAGEGTGENANGCVTVREDVTKELMDDLTAQNYPTLTFTAYASQLMQNNTTEFSAYQAWVNVYNP